MTIDTITLQVNSFYMYTSRFNVILDHSNKQISSNPSSTNDTEEWKCRGCNGTIRNYDNRCYKCEKCKLIRSYSEIHSNQAKRNSLDTSCDSYNSSSDRVTDFSSTSSLSRRVSLHLNIPNGDQLGAAKPIDKPTRLSASKYYKLSISIICFFSLCCRNIERTIFITTVIKR